MNLNTDVMDRLEEIASRMESTLDGLKAKAEEEIREEMAVEFEDMEDELQQAEELAEQYRIERDRFWKALNSNYQRDLVPPTDK